MAPWNCTRRKPGRGALHTATPSSTRRTQQRGFPHAHGVAHTWKGVAKVPVVQRHGSGRIPGSGDSHPGMALPHRNLGSADSHTGMGWFLPGLHRPGFLWFNFMLHVRKTSAKIHMAHDMREASEPAAGIPTPARLGTYRPRQLRQWRRCRLSRRPGAVSSLLAPAAWCWPYCVLSFRP